MKSYLLYIAWFCALAGTVTSLYFSEVLKFAPCELCWIQRICLYPLTVILLIAMLRRDYKVYLYALPLTIIGGLVAFYHVLLNAGVIAENLAPCRLGVSCTTKYFEFFGFINIPFLSLMAFLLIGVCMVWIAKLENKKTKNKKTLEVRGKKKIRVN